MKKGLLFCVVMIILALISFTNLAILNKGGKIKQEFESKPMINTAKKIPLENETKKIINIKAKIHPSLPEFLFKVYAKKNDTHYGANKIVVLKSGDLEEIIQEITFNETDLPDVVENLGFEIEDMNFDGYEDIRIQQFLPAAPNIPYYYWLWDKKAFRFISNSELEQITSPQVDNKSKTIKSFVRVDAITRLEDTYKYIDGIPTLIREQETVYDDDNKVIHVTIKELRAKNMKVIKKYEKK